MNGRQRFKETMSYGAPDRVPFFEEGVRKDVLEAWAEQGLEPGTDLASIFTYDRRDEIAPDLDPLPKQKKYPSSRAELKAWRRFLNANDPARLPDDWAEKVQSWRNRDHMVMLRAHRGFFLTMGVYDWRRFNELIYLVKDDPVFVREMMTIQGEFAAALADRILEEVEIDAVIFGEPIGGNDRSLISPALYEELVLTSYEPIREVLDRHNVETIILLTYANTRVLIPSALKWGFNCLWASEANQEAMDYRAIRREFGRDLRLIGGIDLDTLRLDKKAIQSEMEEKVPPLVADGGYIPLADGRVRDDVSFENYCFYRRLLEQMCRP